MAAISATRCTALPLYVSFIAILLSELGRKIDEVMECDDVGHSLCQLGHSILQYVRLQGNRIRQGIPKLWYVLQASRS